MALMRILLTFAPAPSLSIERRPAWVRCGTRATSEWRSSTKSSIMSSSTKMRTATARSDGILAAISLRSSPAASTMLRLPRSRTTCPTEPIRTRTAVGKGRVAPLEQIARPHQRRRKLARLEVVQKALALLKKRVHVAKDVVCRLEMQTSRSLLRVQFTPKEKDKRNEHQQRARYSHCWF